MVVYIIKAKFMNKSLIIRSIVIGSIFGIVLYGISTPQTINADLENITTILSPATLIANGHLTICKIDKSSYQVVKTIKMIVTAYSSTPDQTDNTPFVTASGKKVEDGIVANNMLPFGTKIRIPELYGNKTFVVEDRMHKRKGTKMMDVWMEKTKEAKEFGAKYNISIEVLEI